MATKAELEKQRDEIQSQIDLLETQLEPIENAISEIENIEWQSTIDGLNKQYGVKFEIGKEFVVNQAIADYATERKFGKGYYPSWIVGQKAYITDIDMGMNGYLVRADCDTGHTYKQGIGLNDEQRNKQIKLMSLNTPFPIELIAEALHGS